ncbi:Aspartate carbamoyltransferase (Aspartate transcarbamylase) (ATCase) [[Clostridium] sordellii]|uniref:aspartate carbamoyltransferase n=1 Tax=Paraclostridium sordellii TaxID=1505 RepID=UPI0005E3CE31|nr:aspartate carbamoyltransferase [Paeniclostridium sordellii]MDU2148829.1 aspartate carbamoyltransferase [Paeniclostridium sordellii]CEN85538.1 Aspartate carbamoyltransferase (Aspartate transcarbamylase) (ATCase) [[Clostridium] sordellii] [Paeniclostridium sordellii]CEQ25262.1 Aspartate carbamoyltransferase (Aspartate transcarbamylase) (ATCase) [[Clostridium] sordellii] [Paeniclostridium sordellii]CEQ31940.1 Aspartate carbamoyltransferase (Aspartate transcarbamylase) (ATCase) [[Clostridium] so
MKLKGRNLIQPEDFSINEIDEILSLSQNIIDNPSKYSSVCEGNLLATLFYEPSTRTRFSFEAAMNRLGGRVIGFSEPKSSSTAKGETLEDTMETVSCYADAIVMRHPRAGSALEASRFARVPFINAGDGGNQHPTQTLTDILTIKSLKGKLENHTIGLCGDLKNGRTVHSLVKAMSRYKDTKFVFIAPKELKMPDYIKEAIKGHDYIETNNLDEVIGELDVLYMTRVQQERFENKDEYERLKDYYILTAEKMKKAKSDMLVMHPLPRVNEIDTEVDKDKRAVYFDQAKFGMYVRMALIMKLLGVDANE